MAVYLVCKCGRQLYIPEDHAGRQVKCPGCGESHLAPAESPGFEKRARSAANFSGRPRGRGKGLVLALVILVLLAGGGAVWWFWWGRGEGRQPEGDDLALIPANAQAFVSIRLADLWNSPAAQKALKQPRDEGKPSEDPAEKMERETGVRPEEVERLTLVTINADEKMGWLLARTLRPYDRAKVLARLSDGRQEIYRGRTYHLGTGPDNQQRAVYFAGTRVIVAGTEEGVKRCLHFAAGERVKGPLEPVIALAGGKHTAVAGGYPAGGPMEKVKNNANLKNLEKVKLITATMDVTDRAHLETKAKLSSADEARDLQQVIERQQEALRGNPLLRVALILGISSALGEDLKPLAPTMVNVLVKTKVGQKGDEILATTDLDQAATGKLILALPGALKK
jgi:hypothetical protein